MNHCLDEVRSLLYFLGRYLIGDADPVDVDLGHDVSCQSKRTRIFSGPRSMKPDISGLG